MRRELMVGVPGWRWVLAALLLVGGRLSAAQGVFNFPVPSAVGGAAQTLNVGVRVATAGNLNSMRVMTQGSPDLDFSVTGGGTCSPGAIYNVGDTCTVAVLFQPRYPGGRHGAVVLVDSTAREMGTTYLEAMATGSLAVLTPARIDTVAGDFNWTYSGDGQPAITSSIFLPMGEVTDAAGNLYIADTNNSRVRRVEVGSGIITTVAGSYSVGYGGDGGPGTSAMLNGPTGLAMDGAGRLFIADSGNYVVRMLDTLTGIITTVAGASGPSNGNPGDGGPATSAHLSAAEGVALDTQHRLYIADTGNNAIRRVDLTTGIITLFAGFYTQGYGGDGGPAIGALLSTPQGITFGPDGSLYIADLNNNLIRKVSPVGIITTVAGGGNDAMSEGLSPSQVQLVLPAGVAVDQANNLYIADAGSNRIRKLTAATGLVTTIAGNGGETFTGDGNNANLAQIYGPYSIYYDGQGNLFIADIFHNRIREIYGNQGVLQYTPLRVNRVSAPQPELLENDGNAVLNLATPVLADGLLDPSSSCATPGTLAAGSSCMLEVSFAPTVLGNPAIGTITLPSDAGNTPAVLTLAGKSLLTDPTATTLASNLNPAGFGVPVTFSAHVTTQGTTVTGTVQFLNGGVVIGTGTLNAAHIATFTTSILPAGPNIITAFYEGDATNGTSTSAPLTESVKQQTTTVLQSSANPSYATQAVTLTATVTGRGMVPSGTLTFAADGVTLGAVSLDSNGMATWTVSTLAIGQHMLTASYGGDTTDSPGASNVISQTVLGQTSTTALASSSLVVPVGSSVAFSVQVTGSNTAVATGTVTIKDGAGAIALVTLDPTGAGTFSTAMLSPASHTIVAVYSGDANYAGSSSAALVETVQQINTTSSVTASVNPAPAGGVVVLTATVAPASLTGGPFGGAITFTDGGIVLGSPVLSAGGVATLSIATLGLGTHAIVVSYPGSVNYLPSRAAALPLTVVQAATTTALATSATPAVAEDPVTLTATVTGTGGRATGVVTFLEGTVTLGQGTLNAAGAATLTLSKLIVGQHTLTASYAGDLLDLPSVSVPLGQTITLRPTSDVLTSSATSLSGGQQVTLISVVEWTGPLVPTGTVTFTSGSMVLGTSPVDATGVATLTVNPQIGLTSVVAAYGGDSWYAGSTSSTVTINVGPSLLFTVSANKTSMSMATGQHGMVDVTVTSIKGFTDDFAMGCLGLPFAATCTWSVDQVNLPADGSQTMHVVVDTGSPLTAGPVARNEATGTGLRVLLCGLPFACFLLRKRLRVRGTGLLLGLFALGAMAGLAGCGTLTTHSTPPGTYHFQLTAEAKGVAVLQSVNMTLTVTP